MNYTDRIGSIIVPFMNGHYLCVEEEKYTTKVGFITSYLLSSCTFYLCTKVERSINYLWLQQIK
jgi:hypothetical protein